MINRKVTYGRLQSLGDYSNVKVEVTLETVEDDITVTALLEGARHEVEVEVDRASEHAGRGLVFSREQTFTMSVYKEENAVVIYKAPSAKADSYRIDYVKTKIAECYQGWQVFWDENPFTAFAVARWDAEKVIAVGGKNGALTKLVRDIQARGYASCMRVVYTHYNQRTIKSLLDEMAEKYVDFQIYNVTDDNLGRLPRAVVEPAADEDE